MIEFKELKYLIQKACKSDNSEDINNGFSFSIDVEKLEKILNTKTDLHVLAFSKELNSRYAKFEDLQLLTEYITDYTKKKELESLYNNSAQIVEFMLYCNKNGAITLDSEDGTIDNEELFEYINNPDKLDSDIILSIIENFPIYRTLIIKRFNHKKEKFEYQIYFRSNYSMITYIKELKEAREFDNKEDKE